MYKLILLVSVLLLPACKPTEKQSSDTNFACPHNNDFKPGITTSSIIVSCLGKPHVVDKEYPGGRFAYLYFLSNKDMFAFHFGKNRKLIETTIHAKH